jgi:putative ABC transport system permease protein
VKTLETYLGETALAPLRIAMAIVAVFAATAVLLSVIGLYGAVADAARRRNRELAIRVALGARRFDVVMLMLGEGGRLVAAGSLAGLAGALLLSQRLADATPGAAPPVGWTWLAGPLLLVVAVLGASLLPARRGSMVDPVAALRADR